MTRRGIMDIRIFFVWIGIEGRPLSDNGLRAGVFSHLFSEALHLPGDKPPEVRGTITGFLVRAFSLCDSPVYDKRRCIDMPMRGHGDLSLIEYHSLNIKSRVFARVSTPKCRALSRKCRAFAPKTPNFMKNQRIRKKSEKKCDFTLKNPYKLLKILVFSKKNLTNAIKCSIIYISKSRVASENKAPSRFGKIKHESRVQAERSDRQPQATERKGTE